MFFVYELHQRKYSFFTHCLCIEKVIFWQLNVQAHIRVSKGSISVDFTELLASTSEFSLPEFPHLHQI